MSYTNISGAYARAFDVLRSSPQNQGNPERRFTNIRSLQLALHCHSIYNRRGRMSGQLEQVTEKTMEGWE